MPREAASVPPEGPRKAPATPATNGGAGEWVQIRVKIPPEWRAFFQDQADAHACTLSDEIRYCLGHWKSQLERAH